MLTFLAVSSIMSTGIMTKSLNFANLFLNVSFRLYFMLSVKPTKNEKQSGGNVWYSVCLTRSYTIRWWICCVAIEGFGVLIQMMIYQVEKICIVKKKHTSALCPFNETLRAFKNRLQIRRGYFHNLISYFLFNDWMLEKKLSSIKD